MTALEEQELVGAARAGSARAISDLFERHWADAWRAARAITGSSEQAADVAQDAFEQAIKGLPGFNGRASFATWLHRIVVNRALNVARAERRSLPVGDARGLAEGPAFVSERAEEVLAALGALPPDQRAVVVLRHWLGYSIAETAELLGVPPGTVQSRQARALGELRRRLEVSDAR
jgi:RNA polymerase sigma-70 factor (ECF subfamily)